MRKTASVAPSTVTKVSKGLVAAPVARRERAVESRVRTSRVAVTRVNPAVMEVALRAAGGDASRIEVVSATEVIVR